MEVGKSGLACLAMRSYPPWKALALAIGGVTFTTVLTSAVLKTVKAKRSFEAWFLAHLASPPRQTDAVSCK